MVYFRRSWLVGLCLTLLALSRLRTPQSLKLSLAANFSATNLSEDEFTETVEPHNETSKDRLVEDHLRAEDHLLENGLPAEDLLLENGSGNEDHLVEHHLPNEDHLVEHRLPNEDHLVENRLPKSCCYSGIRCQKTSKPYRIYVSSNGHAIYAPMVSTVVVGLKERQMKCGYEVKEVVEKIKKKKISDSQLNSVIYPGRVSAGDVWIHVGRWLQPEFFEHCKRLAEQQVYCILYQSDPFNVTAPVGVCEIWEYTHGNFPQAPVVRTIPAGFLPLWKHGNDQEVEKRSHDFNLQKLQWVFMGHLNKANRMQCWNHLRTMPELQHVSFTNHIRGFRDAETWKKLARTPNVIFLNLHQYCNETGNSTQRLETVRISSVLSFGALMISEATNEADMDIFKDIVVFEKNLFLNYSSWSWQLKDLLRSSHRIKAFQRKAYTLYKQKFAPGRLLSDAKVWDREEGPNCSA